MRINLLNLVTTITLSIVSLSLTAQQKEAQRMTPRNSKITRTVEATSGHRNLELLKPITKLQASNNKLRAPLSNASRPQTKKLAPATTPKLNGAVIFADGWGKGNTPFGLYSIDPTGCKMFINGVKATDGGVLSKDNIFYAHELEDDDFFGPSVYIREYNVNTGERIDDGDFDCVVFGAKYAAADITIDPTTGNAYGIFWNDDDMKGYMLASINYKSPTKKVTKLMDLPGDWCAIASDNEGHIYAVSREIVNKTVVSSTLYLIVDSEQELVAKIGTVTGVCPLYASSMTFNETGDKIYWNVCPADGTSAIYELDTTTGVATKLYDLPGNEEIMGLYVVKEASTNNPPAAPTKLTATFNEGSLTGSVSFTTPSTDASGASISGSLTYKLSDGDKLLKEGTCTAGETVTVPVTLLNSGNHKFSVTVANDNGTSEAATITFYAGFATPKAPANVKLTVIDGTATVTWDPVTDPYTYGYFDKSAIKYNVVRNPGAIQVVTEGTATTFSEQLPPTDGYTAYNYSVTAINGNVQSAAGMSNSYIIGTLEPPYLEDFSDASTFSTFTSKNWKYNNKGYASVMFGTGNDWLISPPIKLKAGQSYEVSVDIACYISWNPEKFEICYGTAATPEAMTGVLVPETEISSQEFTPYSKFLTPESDGDYYIGIHCTTPAIDTYGLLADNLRIEAPMSNDVPAKITDFRATGDPNGKTLVNISFTAPTLTFDGKPLTSIDRIEVKRGDISVHTFDSPATGAALTCVDNSPAAGENTYTAIVYSGALSSQPATAVAYVGYDKPQTPANLSITENPDGVITVNWDNVTTGIHGGPINPDLVTYDVAVYDGFNMDIKSYGVEHGPVTFRAIEDGNQEYLQVIVFPIVLDENFDELEGEPAMSAMMPIGTPATGYRESFSNALISTIIGIDTEANSSVNVYGIEESTPSQDNDGGFIGIRASAAGASASFMTGKIDLGNMVEPALSFYSFTIVDPDANVPSKNKIKISVAEPGHEFTPVYETTVNALGEELGWYPVNVPLTAFAGKTVIIKVTGETVNMQHTLFDNFRVGSSIDYDIELSHISGPARADAGATYTVNVLYENTGIKDAENFAIELYCDGDLIATNSVESLKAGASGAMRFNVTMHQLATENVLLEAKVAFANDENEANNKSEQISVRPIVSTLPVVTDLSGEVKDGVPTLSWSEPAFGDYCWSLPVKESFETGGSFATEFEGWTFIDNDKQPTGSFKELEMPGIADKSLQSFWVFDSSLPQFQGSYQSSFTATTGDKYLVSMYTHEGSNDDWAISPELSGEAQFISFYGRRYHSGIAEAFEFLYSDTEPTIESFKLMDKVTDVPREWTMYEYELPAGARYFAIRYCATNAMMLMLDDFTFTPKGKPGTLELKGFNIYRDGKLLNESPIEDFEYEDKNPVNDNAKYVATAVYTQGESAGSAPVLLSLSGIENALTDAVTVTGLTGEILITGADTLAVSVYDISGRVLYTAIGSENMRIPVPAGAYLVNVSDKTFKTVVR